VLTASIAPRDRELVEQLGAAEFVTKPITFTALCELARRLLTEST
jgi:CheY-like chemotaxis protein